MDWMSATVDFICDLRFLVDFVFSLESALVVVFIACHIKRIEAGHGRLEYR